MTPTDSNILAVDGMAEWLNSQSEAVLQYCEEHHEEFEAFKIRWRKAK